MFLYVSALPMISHVIGKCCSVTKEKVEGKCCLVMMNWLTMELFKNYTCSCYNWGDSVGVRMEKLQTIKKMINDKKQHDEQKEHLLLSWVSTDKKINCFSFITEIWLIVELTWRNTGEGSNFHRRGNLENTIPFYRIEAIQLNTAFLLFIHPLS